MKKLYTAIVLAGALSVLQSQAAYDGTVLLTANSPFQNGSGGEFWAASSGLGNFATFCTEVNEHLSFGGTYNYRKNTGAVQGGTGATSVDPNTTLAMDLISYGTAWLYSQMRAGTLTLSTGSGSYFDANRNANAGELQQAIWFLEGESLGVNNGYVTLAATAAGNLALAQAASGGAFGVIALNLFDGPAAVEVTAPDGSKHWVNQDVLAIVPEPTTMIAGALLLLPFAASSIRFIRKNRAA